jgi:hypothetical protein
LEKDRKWLSEDEKRENKVIEENIGDEKKNVEEKMKKEKKLKNEFVEKGRIIDEVKKSVEEILRYMEGKKNKKEKDDLEKNVVEMEEK